MLPIALDPANVDTAVVGRSALAIRRLVQLRELGADPVVYSDAPSAMLEELAGARLRARLPTRKDLKALHVVWIADLEERVAAQIAADARAEKTLVNVEDMTPYCDFHTPAVVKRGALVLSASTGGASPAAARFARETLENAFPEAWSEALDEAAAARRAARSAGQDTVSVMAQTKDIFARRGLLPPAPNGESTAGQSSGLDVR